MVISKERIDELRCKAAALLESRPNAWCQGTFRQSNDDGTFAFCAYGALREVAGYYDLNSLSNEQVKNYTDEDWDAFERRRTDLINDVNCAGAAEPFVAVTFNDTPNRTVEEVIARLRSGRDCKAE